MSDDLLPSLLEALASDCDSTDGWEGAASDLRQAAAEIRRLRKQVAGWEQRAHLAKLELGSNGPCPACSRAHAALAIEAQQDKMT